MSKNRVRFDPTSGSSSTSSSRRRIRGMDADSAEPDSDEALHSSDEEVEERLKNAEGARVSSVHALLGQRDDHSHPPLSIGSLNSPSSHYEYDEEDQLKKSCCSKANLAWGCLGLVVLIALAVLLNVRYHIGPNTKKSMPFLHHNAIWGSVGSTTQIPSQQKENPPFDLEVAERKGKGKAGEKMRFTRRESMSTDQLRADLHRLEEPVMNRFENPAHSSLPSAGQLRQEMQQLSAALHHMHLNGGGSSSSSSSPGLGFDLPSLAPLENVPDIDPKQPSAGKIAVPPPTPEEEGEEATRDLEEELHLGTSDELQSRVLATERHLGLLHKLRDPEFEKRMDRDAQMEFMKGLKRHKERMEEEWAEAERRTSQLVKEVEEEDRTKRESAYHSSHPSQHDYPTPPAGPAEHEDEGEWVKKHQTHHAIPSAENEAREFAAKQEKRKGEKKEKGGKHRFRQKYEEHDLSQEADAEEKSSDPLLHSSHPPSNEQHRSYGDAGTMQQKEVEVDHPPSLGGDETSHTAPLPPPPTDSLGPPFDLSDRSLLPFPVPDSAVQQFDYCVGCKERCEQVVKSLDFHSSSLSPGNRAMKFSLLSSNAIDFYRGTPHLMWEAVEQRRRREQESHTKGKKVPPSYSSLFSKFTSPFLQTWITGDLHLDNIGAMDGGLFVGGKLQGEGEIRVDLSDFDQALISSSYYVDILRLLISIVLDMSHLASSHTEEHSSPLLFTRSQMEETVRYGLEEYYTAVHSFLNNDSELTFSLLPSSLPPSSPLKKWMEKRAKKHSRKEMLKKYTRKDEEGKRVFNLAKHKLKAISPTDEREIRTHWDSYIRSIGQLNRLNMDSLHRHSLAFEKLVYMNADGSATLSPPSSSSPLPSSLSSFYTVKSLSSRVESGLGSLGVKRFWALVEGPTEGWEDDVILDIKQQVKPAWWQYREEGGKGGGGEEEEQSGVTGTKEHEKVYGSDGQRGIMGQEALSSLSLSPPSPSFFHSQSAPHAGWLSLPTLGSFSVRSRSPFKATLPYLEWRSIEEWKSVLSSLMHLLAASHCRSDNDYDIRLIPSSFEETFSHVVGEKEKGEWMGVMEGMVWEELGLRDTDWKCWKEHMVREEVKQKEEEEKPEKEEEEADETAAAAAEATANAAPTPTASTPVAAPAAKKELR
jgi:hypothetical protein